MIDYTMSSSMILDPLNGSTFDSNVDQILSILSCSFGTTAFNDLFQSPSILLPTSRGIPY